MTFISFFNSFLNIYLLCSWDKSLNIGSCMLRIFFKVPSFTFDSLNCMQQIRSDSFYILVTGQKSFIFLMTFCIIWLCVCYNQRAKGIKEKGIILKSVAGPLNKFSREWHDLMRASWCTSCLEQLAAYPFKRSNVKEWTLRKIRNMQLPIVKLLSQGPSPFTSHF